MISKRVLSAIRLRNFRSLEDTQEIAMRPIVLLVGANSSGKSSFLRFFPLLRQTAHTHVSGPLLWYGDDVDFGDFGRVIGAGSDPAIEVALKMRLPRDPRWNSQDADVALTSRIIGDRERAWVERCTVEVFGHTVELELASDGDLKRVLINAEEFVLRAPPDAPVTAMPSLGLVPLPSALAIFAQGARQRLKDAINSRIHGRTGWDRIDALAAALRPGIDWDVHDLMRRAGPESWNHDIGSIRSDDPYVRRIGGLLVVRELGPLLESLAASLNTRARAMGYVGPFRTAPLRYYRKQDLAVDRISRDGENLAMFLRSLDQNDRADFSTWVRTYFGFGVRVEQEGAHVSLMVETPNRPFHLIDMGFGMSQVLPIVAQCWLASRALSRKREQPLLAVASMLAIEQPELHLHPMHQANLADMLAGVVAAERSTGRWIPMIIETHSNALINRLGELISEQRVRTDEVSVLLFEKGDDGISRVREATFDDDGVLKNWPVGFLSA